MTTEHKNLYEDLIETMMIDGIKGMTPELRAIIETAPVEKQRELILNFMEENNPEHRLLCGEIRKVVANNKTSEYKHITSLVQMLRDYVKVSDVEVKTMGEVMTPISLVEEMLDTLPYEVWTNPNLKWLDPCNGVGTFFSVVVKRLMKGLETFQPVAELRYKHIMENMIYVCELQAKNVFLYMYAFDPEDRYAINIFNGSYLSEEFNKHMAFWGVEKFDVIVMNPPYNQSSSNASKAHSLWDKFVIKTINQLVEGGYLVAVHPSGWRNITGKFKNVQTLLKSKQLLYLEIHSEKDGLKVFGANTRYDWYCLHNVLNTMFTKIKCQDGTTERADLSKMEFIPNGKFDIIQKLLAKGNEETVDLLHSYSAYMTWNDYMSKEQIEDFKYPCVSYAKRRGEPTVYYSNINNKGHFGISKLVMSNGRLLSVGCILDVEGKYGMTEYAFAIVDDIANLPRIKQAIDNSDFRDIMLQCAVNDEYLNKRILATFRKDFWKEFLY